MPNEKDLHAYADVLPEIYRDILAAFPAIEPRRNPGYGLAFQTLAAYFANTRKPWTFGDVQAACEQLADGGFVEIKNGIFAHPTEIGEQLIAAVTGKTPAANVAVPALPTRPW